jgi:hypothetical protein
MLTDRIVSAFTFRREVYKEVVAFPNQLALCQGSFDG